MRTFFTFLFLFGLLSPAPARAEGLHTLIGPTLSGVVGGKELKPEEAKKAGLSGEVSVRYLLSVTDKEGKTTKETLGDCSAGIFEQECVVTTAHCFRTVNLVQHLGRDGYGKLSRAEVSLEVSENGNSDDPKAKRYLGDTALGTRRYPKGDLVVFKLKSRVNFPTFTLSQIPDSDELKEGDSVRVLGSGPDKLENPSAKTITLKTDFKGHGPRRGVLATVGPSTAGQHWLAPRPVDPKASDAEKVRARFWTGPGDSGGMIVSPGEGKDLKVLGMSTEIDFSHGSGFISLSGEKKIWLKDVFEELGCH